jgi:hypothetical protein
MHYQGRLNDVNKEFRVARDQGKFIVSPYWLMAVSSLSVFVEHEDVPNLIKLNNINSSIAFWSR